MLRQISYEPLEGALQDLDISMYSLCREAAPDVKDNLELLHSGKLWLYGKVRYESANSEVLFTVPIESVSRRIDFAVYGTCRHLLYMFCG